MGKFTKKVLGSIILGGLFVLPVSSLAASIVYNSTYEMSGGVNSKVFNVNAPGTFQVETTGTSISAYNGLTFTVFLKKAVSGPDSVISQKDDHKAVGYQSTTFNITTARGSGDYYAYLRNFTGNTFSGNITITTRD